MAETVSYGTGKRVVRPEFLARAFVPLTEPNHDISDRYSGPNRPDNPLGGQNRDNREVWAKEGRSRTGAAPMSLRTAQP